MDVNINLDSIKPKSLNDYETNIKLVNKLKNLAKYSEINNLTFQGKSGSGKYTLILCLLADIYGKNIFNKKKNNI